ncbi:MAG TPA: CDP-archaeol synthase [Gammaproteobacteria bacterium]|nr:CDP-archaeol synthase [Gammaproteobacteria bacterium]
MFSLWRVLEALLLVLAANGAPILLARLTHGRTLPSVDFGCRLGDGQPLFGRSKTWPGVMAAIVATSLVGLMLGHSWLVGAAAGAAAMVGDLCSSFIKRRLGIPPSGQAFLLDQIPEALLPALVLSYWLPLTAVEVLAATVLFLLLGSPLSLLLFRLGIRKKPY